MSPHARWAPLFIVLVTACDQEPPTGTTFLLGKVLASMPAELGGPLRLLTPDEQQRFARGSVVFQTVFTPETGLGPLFNSTACAGCHERSEERSVGKECRSRGVAYHERKKNW